MGIWYDVRKQYPCRRRRLLRVHGRQIFTFCRDNIKNLCGEIDMLHKHNKAVAVLLAIALLLCAMPQTAALNVSDYSGGMAGEGTGIFAYGVDLSSWQGDSVDFQKIKEQGYDFVILRAGFSNTCDKTFERNYAAAKAAGLDVGAYLYSYAATTEAAALEAESCKDWLAGKQFEYPIYFDLEDPEVHGGLSAATLTAIAETFLASLCADGWLVGLYSCRSWLEGKIDTPALAETYEGWIAQYPSDGSCDAYVRYHAEYGLWQYSASGSVDGIPGNADLDVAFKDYPSICREYGFNGYEAEGEAVVLRNASAPTVLKRGETFEVGGCVVSREGNLLSVTLGVYDAEGEMCTGATAEPNAAQYELSLLRHHVDLSSLSDGEYLYRISAKTALSERTLLSGSFAVTENGLWLHEQTLPQGMKEGTALVANGIVTASTTIHRLTFGVVASDGETVLSATCTPQTTQVDLSSLGVELSGLTLGTYYYHIEVVTADETITLDTDVFQVWVKSDPIILSDFALDNCYTQGEQIGLTGKLTSQNSPMLIEAAVYDADETLLYRVRVPRKTRIFDLSGLDALLHLGRLPLGYYELELSATNDAGPIVLKRTAFSIVRDGMSLCSAVIPTTLGQGNSFLLEGVIASDQSQIEYVSMRLTDERGVAVCSAEHRPDAHVFALNELNAALRFSDLPPGEYRLRIMAQNAEETDVLFDEPIQILPREPLALWQTEHTAVQGLTFTEGMTPGFYGTLAAEETITSVTAQLLSENNEELSSCTLAVDAQSVSTSLLNEQLRLNALTEGTYHLRLLVQCGNAEELVLAEEFSISSCAHTHVRTGTTYAATCTTPGAIAATRCLTCGQAVRAGEATPERGHSYEAGSCTSCSVAERNEYSVRPTAGEFSSDERYLLAVETERGFYALDADGTARFVGRSLQSADASLFWAITHQRDGSYLLTNYRGLPLHLDSGGLCTAVGRGHTAFIIADGEEGFSLSCGKLCVGFDQNDFIASQYSVDFACFLIDW